MKLNRPKTINCSDSNFNEALNNSFSNVIVETEPDEKIVISDVIFDSCYLSNKEFNERLISRVEFINCKLVGTTFIDSSIRDVLFNKCQAKYINFSDSIINKVSIENTDLTDASFNCVKIKDINFSKNNFYRCEFLKTKLTNVDFSDSNIEGIIFDNYSLKGIIIEPFQSASIVGMLGVNFKDLKS